MFFKALKAGSLIFLVGFGAAQFKRPQRISPSTEPTRSLQAITAVPPDVGAILERSCGDCHSNQTEWPWYSNVAPVSWFVSDHVNHGRRHLNFSEWGSYDQRKREKLLEAICEWVEKDRMPLDSYALIHRDATLTPEDKQTLCDWARSEVDRVHTKSKESRL